MTSEEANFPSLLYSWRSQQMLRICMCQLPSSIQQRIWLADISIYLWTPDQRVDVASSATWSAHCMTPVSPPRPRGHPADPPLAPVYTTPARNNRDWPATDTTDFLIDLCSFVLLPLFWPIRQSRRFVNRLTDWQMGRYLQFGQPVHQLCTDCR